MRRYFIDTFYLAALSNRRDQWHRRVLSFSQALADHHLYTVDEVLAEYLTFCSVARPRVRAEAARTVRTVLNDLDTTVLPQSHTSFLDALAFYESRLDKHYSLTDCVAMQAMRREGLTEVLTNDRHFTQEGFQILFRRPSLRPSAMLHTRGRLARGCGAGLRARDVSCLVHQLLAQRPRDTRELLGLRSGFSDT